MVHVVGRAQHFGFIDVIDFDGLQNASFGNMTDTNLCHDRNRHGFLNALDHGRIAHAGNTAGSTNISRNAFERHHRTCARVLCDLRLLRGGDVHDYATLEHLCQILVQFVPVVGHRQPFVESYSTLLQSEYLLTQILTIFRYKIM